MFFSDSLFKLASSIRESGQAVDLLRCLRCVPNHACRQLLREYIVHIGVYILQWRPCRKKDIDNLERIKRRATKIIPELRDHSYESRLLLCGLTRLEETKRRPNRSV